MRIGPSLIIAPVLIAGLAACGPKPTATVAPPPIPATARPQLVASLHEIMMSEVAPAADVIWKSVGTVNNKDVKPETAEDWQRVRNAAVILAEAPNLLVLEGRQVVKTGAKIQDEGQAGNLSSAEMQTRIDADRASFVQYARVLQDSAVAAIAAVDKKDVDGITDVGGKIDEACEACHKVFWYPGAPTIQ